MWKSQGLSVIPFSRCEAMGEGEHRRRLAHFENSHMRALGRLRKRLRSLFESLQRDLAVPRGRAGDSELTGYNYFMNADTRQQLSLSK